MATINTQIFVLLFLYSTYGYMVFQEDRNPFGNRPTYHEKYSIKDMFGLSSAYFDHNSSFSSQRVYGQIYGGPEREVDARRKPTARTYSSWNCSEFSPVTTNRFRIADSFDVNNYNDRMLDCKFLLTASCSDKSYSCDPTIDYTRKLTENENLDSINFDADDTKIVDIATNLTIPVHARYFGVDSKNELEFDAYATNVDDDKVSVRQTFVNSVSVDGGRYGKFTRLSNGVVQKFWAVNSEQIFDISRVTMRVSNRLSTSINYFYIYHIGAVAVNLDIYENCHPNFSAMARCEISRPQFGRQNFHARFYRWKIAMSCAKSDVIPDPYFFYTNDSISITKTELENGTRCECRVQIFFPLKAFNTDKLIMREGRNSTRYIFKCLAEQDDGPLKSEYQTSNVVYIIIGLGLCLVFMASVILIYLCCHRNVIDISPENKKFIRKLHRDRSRSKSRKKLKSRRRFVPSQKERGLSQKERGPYTGRSREKIQKVLKEETVKPRSVSSAEEFIVPAPKCVFVRKPHVDSSSPSTP